MDSRGRLSAICGTVPGMADLALDSTALRDAAAALRRAVAEADALPVDAASAWIRYDAGPGPVGTATAHFAEGCCQAVRAMVHSGGALADWLLEAAELVEAHEAALTARAGPP